MNKNGLDYQPPKAKIYRFDDSDRILTDSGVNEVLADNAANSLNEFLDVTTTTVEIN